MAAPRFFATSPFVRGGPVAPAILETLDEPTLDRVLRSCQEQLYQKAATGAVRHPGAYLHRMLLNNILPNGSGGAETPEGGQPPPARAPSWVSAERRPSRPNPLHPSVTSSDWRRA